MRISVIWLFQNKCFTKIMFSPSVQPTLHMYPYEQISHLIIPKWMCRTTVFCPSGHCSWKNFYTSIHDRPSIWPDHGGINPAPKMTSQKHQISKNKTKYSSIINKHFMKPNIISIIQNAENTARTWNFPLMPRMGCPVLWLCLQVRCEIQCYPWPTHQFHLWLARSISPH